MNKIEKFPTLHADHQALSSGRSSRITGGLARGPQDENRWSKVLACRPTSHKLRLCDFVHAFYNVSTFNPVVWQKVTSQ